MVNRRIGTGKLKEILKLYEQGLSYRKIVAALAISRPVVSQYITDYRTVGISYHSIKGLSDSYFLISGFFLVRR